MTAQLAMEPPKGPSCAEQAIQDECAAKVQMTPVKGNRGCNIESYIDSAYVDEEYLVIGSHLDESICKKIINHEYVDFAKLLPRDRLSVEEDTWMELVNRNGMSFWSPISEREVGTINNFQRWESAFRVYSNIYTTQYSHVMHTASLTYVWENIYLYDHEFRIHMSKFPQRSWSIILQQAWNLRLKDKIRFNKHEGNGKPWVKNKEICQCFNCSQCHSGSSCHYDHCCLECGKFGHGAHICRRKTKQDKGETSKHVNSDAGTAKEGVVVQARN